MHEMSENQYFLILEEVGLFPSLSTNTIEMIEQVMNGVVLSSKSNIQEALNRVIFLEVKCQSLIHQEYNLAVEAIALLVSSFNVRIVNRNIGWRYIVNYNDRRKYFINKIDDINHQFQLLKKITYDGKSITFENTFINWVYDLVNLQHTFVKHNLEDKFMSNTVFPQLTNQIQASIDTIEEETNRYVQKYRKHIKEQEKSIKTS